MFELLGKACADEEEYDLRLERFQAWARAHPFAYRNPNISKWACITYVFADRYDPGEFELLRLLGYSNPLRRLGVGEEFDADLESEIPQIKDIRARARLHERRYSAYAITREAYLKNPVGVNRGLSMEV